MLFATTTRPPQAIDLAGMSAAPAGLCSAKTVVLVSFELRSEAVKSTFLDEATKEFSQVRGTLPPCWLPLSVCPCPSYRRLAPRPPSNRTRRAATAWGGGMQAKRSNSTAFQAAACLPCAGKALPVRVVACGHQGVTILPPWIRLCWNPFLGMQVRRLSKSSLPKGYQVDHIELYELRL